jgi:hypothetical protein
MKWMDPSGKPDPALNYLDRAIDAINSRFGEGYAKAHPELVGWVMQTLAMEYVGNYEEVAEAIKDLASAITDGCERLAGEHRGASHEITKALEWMASAISSSRFEEAAE